MTLDRAEAVRSQSITSTWCKAGSSEQETQRLPFSRKKKIPPFTQPHTAAALKRGLQLIRKLRVLHRGDFLLHLGTGRWKHMDEGCDSPPILLLIGPRSKSDTGQGDYFGLFPNSLRVSSDIPSQHLIVLSWGTFECGIIVEWVDFFSNKEID